MSKRSGRKHKAPSRKRIEIENVPDEIEVKRDKIFPTGALPADFVFHGLSDSAHLELWDLVRGIAWYYLVDTWMAEQKASGASVNEEIGRVAKTAKTLADNLAGLDADTSDALKPHVPPPDRSSDKLKPAGVRIAHGMQVDGLRLKELTSELQNLSDWCDAAVASRIANPQRPMIEAQQIAITALAHDWRHLGEVPTSTPHGSFYSAAEYIGSKLSFNVSGRTVKNAVKDSVNNKEG
jgi:hypothetical protein